jgi:hypothetical protein
MPGGPPACCPAAGPLAHLIFHSDKETSVRKTALLTATLLLPLIALAGEPTDAEVDALLRASHLPDQINTIAGSAAIFARQSITDASKGKDLSDKQKKDLDAVVDKFTARVKTEMTYAKIQPVFSKIYKETFSEDEVKGMTVFFQSPAGTAYLQKLPIIMQKSGEANRGMMVPLMKDLQADIGKVLGK